jgi:hypothetical protein
MRYLAALLALVALPASAATITWTNPTQYEDGSALAAADIASTTIEYSNGTTFGTVAGQVVVNGSATTGTAPDPAAGASRCYRAYTTVVASKGGGRSVVSNVSCKTAAFPNPKPPSLIDVILAWLRSVFGRFA